MRSVESSAKTMEEAVTQGLEKLGVSFADVKIDILDEGSKGFLGILGGKPVVVRLTVREDAEGGEDVLSSVGLEEAVKEPEQKPARKRAPKAKAEKPAAEAKPEKPAAQEKAAQPAKAPKAEKPAKPAKSEKAPAERKQAAPKAEKPASAPEAAQPPADAEAPEGRAFTFLTDVTRLMGVEVTINARRDEEGNVRVDMFGDTLGILIGRRGETLDALQYLTSLYVNKGSEDYIRVTLDTENYRAKREEALRRLANRMANRAVKTGRKVVMEPMNPYERRILHSALQQNDAVTTHSEGEEPNRHVVITLKQQN
ncbi:MAG TPA: protein jag [Candidatus Limiplasma pullistercoris]|nr:protein jag [Candidatus Limiplasma pullistercoris]